MARRQPPRPAPAGARRPRLNPIPARPSSRSQYRFPEAGARFLLFPQAKTEPGFSRPRLVRTAARPGTIGPGPRDDRFEVIDALRKAPYRDLVTSDTISTPPYPDDRPRRRPVRPSAAGHFDHLQPGTAEFAAAATFAGAACVADIWQHYLGRRPRFRLRRAQRRLEIFPHVSRLGDNAYSGIGYLEFGFARRKRHQPYCENLDVVAHEVGHQILWSVIGPARAGRWEFDHRSHEEAAADLVSLVAILHFDHVLTAVLEQTRGRLYAESVAARIGEYRRGRSGRHAIRMALHGVRLARVARARKDGDKHTYAKPFLGAAFEVLVEIYEIHLVRLGLISTELARQSTRAAPRLSRADRRKFAAGFRRHPDGFVDALRAATADFARLLALAWRKTRHRHATFGRVVRNLVDADRRLHGGRYGRVIRRAFGARGIRARSTRA